MSTPHHLQLGPVTAHAFNKNRDAVAICPNTNEVHIYRLKGSKWEKAEVLAEHDHKVTGVDWAPNSDTIVTCGFDRNAYVWKKDGATWKPSLVLLRINRSATCVKWAPNEKKFAVGTGDKVACICSFDEEGDWWVSKHIKNLQSTVLSLDWHPNSVLIAIGTSALKASIVSTYLKGEEDKPSPTVWGKKMPFGEVMYNHEQPDGGWIHGVSFNEKGTSLALVSHDASFTVIEGADGGSHKVSTIPTRNLPMRSLVWVSDRSIVTGGHDCFPVVFSKEGSEWTCGGSLDQQKKAAAGGMSAMNRFKQLDNKGREDTSNETVLNSVHQNSICDIQVFGGTRSRCSQFSTTGIDGRMVFWNIDTLSSSFSALKI